MNYRAVGRRCAVDFSSLGLPCSQAEGLAILERKGFEVMEVEVVEEARRLVGVATYRRGARGSEAPEIVDCSSLVKWAYGQCGVWLPRRSIQQRELGEPVTLDAVGGGDVIFCSGLIDYFQTDPTDGVGHVGMMTDVGTVIHAAGKQVGVIETPVARFVAKAGFRGVRRYIQPSQSVVTLQTPVEREVETSDDIRWIILQSLPLGGVNSV